MHPQLATFSLAIHLHHLIPVGKTGRCYCCSHINGKQMNILWSNPWISGFVCYTYLLTKNKSVLSLQLQFYLRTAYSSLLFRQLLLSQICIELQNQLTFKGRQSADELYIILACHYAVQKKPQSANPKKSFINCAFKTKCHLTGKKLPL